MRNKNKVNKTVNKGTVSKIVGGHVLWLLCLLPISWGRAQELYSGGNAASIGNEANATTGWTGASVITSDPSDPHSGDYALKIATFDDRSSQEGRRASYIFNAVIGDTYEISIWARPGDSNTSTPAFAAWSGLSGATIVPIDAPGWTRYDFALEATTVSPVIRIYSGKGYSQGGSTDDYVLVDHISIANQNFPVITNIFPDSGNVGIGTTDPGTYKLAVNGKVHAREVKVDLTGWADYVFDRNYDLPTLEEVERHIRDKGHLINVPSADEVRTNGIELGEMDKILLKKIEELTLYLLKEKAERKEQEAMIGQLKERISILENNPWINNKYFER